MPNALIKSRNKAFNHQQGRCYYCEKPIWLTDPEIFSTKHNIPRKAVKLLRCTAEHLIAKQDGGKDVESNIAAACSFCNQKRHQRKKPKEPIAYKQFVTNRLASGRWHLAVIH